MVFLGGLNVYSVDPRTIFRIALLNNSDSIIIAHKYPSGGLKPSTDDINVFEMIKKAFSPGATIISIHNAHA